MQQVESLALDLASAAEIQFNLLRLLLASLFATTPGEEQAAYFRQEAISEDVQNIAWVMLEANQAMVDTTSTLLGNTVVWRRYQELETRPKPQP